MKAFAYLQPDDLSQASAILQKEAQAIPFAGGTDVLGLLKDDILAPDKVVNLKSLPGLKQIVYQAGTGLTIGALTTVADIAEHPLIREKFTILHEAAREVASPQLRNVGTLGGNLCQRPRCMYFRGDFHCIRKGGDICYAVQGHNKYHCVTGGGPCFIVHPSDLAVALLALQAEVQIFAGKKSRALPLSEFFVLPEKDPEHETVLKSGEIVTGVFVPELPPGSRSGYVKFRERAAWDFAVVSVGAVIRKQGDSIRGGHLAFGGVAPVPWQERELQRRLPGTQTDETSLAELCRDILKTADPLDMNAYKIMLTRNLTKRLLLRLTVV